MTRTPLRPLARVIAARQSGQNPDAIERENLRMRHEEQRDKLRFRAEGRLFVLGICFFCAFVVIGARMGHLAASVPAEPTSSGVAELISASRADIVELDERLRRLENAGPKPKPIVLPTATPLQFDPIPALPSEGTRAAVGQWTGRPDC